MNLDFVYGAAYLSPLSSLYGLNECGIVTTMWGAHFVLGYHEPLLTPAGQPGGINDDPRGPLSISYLCHHCG